jgi:hypothetical protein
MRGCLGVSPITINSLPPDQACMARGIHGPQTPQSFTRARHAHPCYSLRAATPERPCGRFKGGLRPSSTPLDTPRRTHMLKSSSRTMCDYEIYADQDQAAISDLEKFLHFMEANLYPCLGAGCRNSNWEYHYGQVSSMIGRTLNE